MAEFDTGLYKLVILDKIKKERERDIERCRDVVKKIVSIRFNNFYFSLYIM